MSVVTRGSRTVDDDASLEGAVAPWGRLSPDIHAHATRLSIRRSSEVSIVSSGAILGVQNDKVTALASLAVVVGLEVTSSLVEAELVEEIMIVVGSIEQLRDRSVGVDSWVSLRKREWVRKVLSRAVRARVVEVIIAARGIDLGDAVVATGAGIRGSTITLPGEWAGSDVPRISDTDTITLSRIVDSPGARKKG